MGELRIRHATPVDWPSIWPFWRDIVAAEDTYVYPTDLDSDGARDLWFGEPPTEVWVAEADDGIVGSYHLGPNHSGPGAHIANVSYMVDARARGGGVGRQMVEHSIARAGEAGFRGIQFNAVAATNIYAVALYERLGFSVIGRIPGGFLHPEQGYVDLLIMYRSLLSHEHG